MENDLRTSASKSANLQPSTDPLAELSDLLGVPVIGVRRLRVRINGHPQPDCNAWELLSFGPDGLPRWLPYVLTRHLRDAYWLTALAIRWGRNPDLPPLTRADGRRALRLIHEHLETDAEETP